MANNTETQKNKKDSILWRTVILGIIIIQIIYIWILGSLLNSSWSEVFAVSLTFIPGAAIVGYGLAVHTRISAWLSIKLKSNWGLILIITLVGYGLSLIGYINAIFS